MKTLTSKILPLVCLLLYTFVFFTYVVSHCHYTRPVDDERQYFSGAAHIAAYNTLSLGTPRDGSSQPPAAHREPLYPFYLSLPMRFFKPFKVTDQVVYDHIAMHKLMRIYNMLLPWSVGILAAWLLWELTGNILLSCLGLLNGLSTTIIGASIRYLSENMATNMLLLHSIALVRFYKKPDSTSTSLLALSAAALVLVKAVFIYYLPLLLLIIFQLGKRELSLKRRCQQTLLALCILTLITGGWMMRNKHFFGAAFIVSPVRAAHVLAVRAEYNKMNFMEGITSLLYYTPIQKSRKEYLLNRYLNNPVSQKAFHEYLRLSTKYSWYKYPRDHYYRLVKYKDQNYLTYAKGRFFDTIFKNFLVSIPMFYQGMFAEQMIPVINLKYPRMWSSNNAALISPLLYLNVFIWFGYCVRSKRYQHVLIFAPVFYVLCMHAFLTLNIPRYNLITVPFFWNTLILSVYTVLSTLARLFKLKLQQLCAA